MGDPTLMRWDETPGGDEVAPVGGKDDALGALIGSLQDRDSRVRQGFPTTARPCRLFQRHHDLGDPIRAEREAPAGGRTSFERAGERIHRPITVTSLTTEPVEGRRVAEEAAAPACRPEPTSERRSHDR